MTSSQHRQDPEAALRRLPHHEPRSPAMITSDGLVIPGRP